MQMSDPAGRRVCHQPERIARNRYAEFGETCWIARGTHQPDRYSSRDAAENVTVTLAHVPVQKIIHVGAGHERQERLRPREVSYLRSKGIRAPIENVDRAKWQ